MTEMASQIAGHNVMSVHCEKIGHTAMAAYMSRSGRMRAQPYASK